jgi:hypothetical protein
MVLFPIALLWVAGVLAWVLWKYSGEPDEPGDEPRRWLRPPRDPRGNPTTPPTTAREERKRDGPQRRKTERSTHKTGTPP